MFHWAGSEPSACRVVLAVQKFGRIKGRRTRGGHQAFVGDGYDVEGGTQGWMDEEDTTHADKIQCLDGPFS